MCSVTFWPHSDGYLLGMNRDERRSRPVGLGLRRVTVGTRVVAHPSEPTGGTWISTNDHGITFALINWYAVPAAPSVPCLSRGDVVVSVRDAVGPSEAASRLAGLDLPRMHPFRLIGIFPTSRCPHEWRWNGSTLSLHKHSWIPQQWLSSGYDEPTAQRIRSAAFESMRVDPDCGSREWLRRLHGSHLPEQGPFSTCMHRDDAATVSYTEVEIGDGTVQMRHSTDPLCVGGAHALDDTLTLPRRQDSVAA